MKDSCYLTVNKKGITKMTKNMPSLKPNERAVRINVKAEDTLFELPLYSIDIDVTEKPVTIQDLELELEKIKNG